MRTDGWFVRDDWLENVGIELEDCSTVSKQEFYDMLYAFTYNDPDGNGVDDTYGLATGSVNLLFPGAFDVLGWQEAPEGSEYAYMSAQYDRNSSAYVDALAYTAKLWMDGLIDPNDITNEGNAYRDRFYEGTVGVVRTFGGWLNTYEPALQENFPEREGEVHRRHRKRRGRVRGHFHPGRQYLRLCFADVPCGGQGRCHFGPLGLYAQR